MTTLEIELNTIELEEEDYKIMKDLVTDKLLEFLDMPYVACLCYSYGGKGEPAIRIVRHEDLSPEMIVPRGEFRQVWKFNDVTRAVSCVQYSHDKPCGETWRFREPEIGEMLMYADCYAGEPELCESCRYGYLEPVSCGMAVCNNCGEDFDSVHDLEEWLW